MDGGGDVVCLTLEMTDGKVYRWTKLGVGDEKTDLSGMELMTMMSNSLLQ